MLLYLYLLNFLIIATQILLMKNIEVADSSRKKEGFQGQKAVVIPRKILSKQCETNEILRSLYITDIGYYPTARFHYRERPNGADQHILIYCDKGSGKALIGKSKLNIGAGDFLFIPMKTGHIYSADETTPWTIYWVHFRGNLSDSLVSQMGKKIKGNKGFIRNNEKCISIFNEMYHELERGYSIAHLMYANMCLWHFLSAFMFSDKRDFSEQPLHTDITDIAINYLTTNIKKSIVLEDIAACVNLSPSHFSYLFKKKTGFAPIEYFGHLKVQKACQYLLFTKLRVKEIAFELGIDDPYYFSRMFAKVIGMSPNAYRKKRI
jgi:AraC-like DNA-binding protein/quercetin dioxygenase-like cupin family protein